MKRVLLVLLLVCGFIYSNDMYSQSSFKSTMAWGDLTYWKASASNGNWNANNWYDATQGWDNHNPNYEGGRNLIFDNDNQTTMNNDFSGSGVGRWRITFAATATISRSISGSTENVFYDNSTQKPKIDNLSSVNHTVGFPIKIGYNPLELNPVNGDLTITSTIDNNGNFIDVYGPNSKVLTISGNLNGTGGISLKQNSKIVFSNTPKAFTGVTVIEAGIIETSVSLSTSLITVKSGAKLTINGINVAINALTIESGGVVEVQAGYSLTVSGTLTNNASEGIILKSPSGSGAPGSLITNGSIAGTGTLKAERYIAAYTSNANGWHLISSPVNTPSISGSTTLAPGTSDDFYAWSEPTYMWLNQKVGSNNITNMANGTGYLVSYQTGATKTMTGTPNNAAVTFTNLSKTATKGEGWHLVGNPFTSAIKWNDGNYTLTNIGGVAKMMGNTGGYTDINTNDIIPAMQGFFVQAASGANTFTIPTAARTHNSASWNKSSENSSILLACNDLDSQMIQESWLRVNGQATEGYDYEYDSHFMALYAPQFYSLAGSEMLSTNTLPDLPAESMIPFGFVKNDATNFSIELKESMEGYEVFLKDLKTNTDQNLTENPVYTFTSEASDDANRFLLHFLSTVGTTELSSPEALKIYSNAGNIYVRGATGKADVYVRNMLGQTMIQRTVNGDGLKVINAENLPAGVYIFSLVNGVQTLSGKVIIK